MNDIQTIIDRLTENDRITRKFNEIESSILTILNFKDLFEVLLNEIQEKFSIPSVWITMIDKSEISSLIKSLETSNILKERMNIVPREVFTELFGPKWTCILANTDLKRYFRLLPPKQKFFIKSLAVIPLSLDGEVIGCLNLADFSEKRFQPGIDTSLLDQLAVKVSLCLSNVTAHEKLKFLAYYDPLTGLPNRRVMEAALSREFSRSRRYKTPMSLAFLDLDGFKKVNDTHGHACGDRLLKCIAEDLTRLSRDCDLVTRYAGDEFVLILPQTSAINAEWMLHRHIKRRSSQPIEINGLTLMISFSYGVASTEETAIEDADGMLKLADQRLYQAKRKLAN
jgi:diguanylate cyclase (GGDEF)-like protein